MGRGQTHKRLQLKRRLRPAACNPLGRLQEALHGPGVQALFPCELVLRLENLQPELFGFALFLLSGGFFGCVSPVTLSLWLVLQGPLHIRVTWGRELASTSSSSQAGSRWSHGGDVSENKTELKGCKCASGLASEPLLGLTLPEQVESCFSPVGLRRRQERRRSFHLRSTQSLAPRSRTDGFRDDASAEHL